MIRLVPMDEADFQTYLAAAIPSYAEEHIAAGRWSREEALRKAEAEYRELLPEGVATPDQYLYSIEDAAGARVGMLWFAVERRAAGPRAFVYDVEIFEPFRRRGYAEQAFKAMEARVRELGLNTISLHVFGHNHAARALYEKLGYIPTNLIMSKTLADDGA
jgi:ribosomal protein S18 acetylase RimI-like enzyme